MRIATVTAFASLCAGSFSTPRKAVEEAHASAKARGLDLNSREILRQADPRLAELVSQVMPTHRATGNIYCGRARLPW